MSKCFKPFCGNFLCFSVATSSRSRRSLGKDAQKRQSALEKLRTGRVDKYASMEDEDDVYDEVDENEYAQLVSKRQREDWIVDDGTGYAENGKEIFDDDDEYEDDYADGIGNSKSSANHTNKNRAKSYSLAKMKKEFIKQEPPKPNRGDIRNLFSSSGPSKSSNRAIASSTKSMDDVKIDVDAIDSLVESITTNNKSSLPNKFSTPQPMKLLKRVQAPMSLNGKRKSVAGNFNRNPFGPPLKKRVLVKEEDFDFDNIVDQNELNTSVKQECSKSSLNSSANNKKGSTSGYLDDVLDDDFTLPDYTADDHEMDVDVKPNVAELDAKLKSSSTASKSSYSSVVKLESDEWISTSNGDSNQQTENVPNILPKEIPFEVDSEGNKLMKFYWFDAFFDASRNSDVVYLFGKVWIEQVKKFVSCSLLGKFC